MNREELISVIKASVIIPPELMNNMRYKTTGLGGLFLDYCSDSRGGVYSLNSNVLFSIYFDTEDDYGRLVGSDLGLEIHQYKNIKPMRSIKKKLEFSKTIDKLNRWIEANKAYLINSIQY